MINEYSCGALVYKIKDSVVYYLVIQQRYTKHFGFPKGHVELNETSQETAIREVLEETGINIELVSDHNQKIYYETHLGNKKEVTFFLAKAINTNIDYQLEEVLRADWLTENEVLNILTYESDLKVFNNLKRYIK